MSAVGSKSSSSSSPMLKILIAECKQEVSTFNPAPSHLSDFHLSTGPELLAAHEGVSSEVSGALEVFRNDRNVQVVPGYGIRAITSAGTLSARDFDELAGSFLSEIERCRQEDLDGVLFCMHGAMAAENEADPEGKLLAETRRILGEEIPTVVSLDLHGVLTDRMLVHADAVVPYHTYPHVDFYQTGIRAAELLLAVVRGEANPVTARVAIPALVRGDELITESGLLGGFMRDAQRIERDPRGLSAGMFIGNPFTDVPELGSSSVVVTNGDEDLAQSEALVLARGFWDVRERLQAPLISLAEMVERVSGSIDASVGAPMDGATASATEATKGTIILTDAADATSSGASGDSNAILRALHEARYGGSVLAPIVDPAAARAAFAAGVGTDVAVTVGGALDPERFTPLPIKAQVRLLSDGYFVSESNGDTWQAGPTAVLQWGKVTLVVTSRAVSLYDRSLFLAHGHDPRRFDAVVVKSPHCQPHFFTEWAEAVLNVDAPGSTSANLPSLGHTRCRRPMFPLDQDVVFRPDVQMFKRTRRKARAGKGAAA